MESVLANLQAKGIQLDNKTVATLTELNRHGQVSLDWPGSSRSVVPNRLIWFSTATTLQKTTSIVSSRLGQRLDEQDTVFRILRTALSQIDPLQQCILTVEGTTMYSFVTRGCELFGVPKCELKVARSNQSLERWVGQLDAAHSTNPRIAGFVSPPLWTSNGKLPCRDRIEILGSDQLLVVKARSQGNVHQLVHERLQRTNPRRVFLAIGSEQLVSPKVAAPLMDKGAIGWYVSSNATTLSSPLSELRPSPATKIVRPPHRATSFLAHCTRRAHGAWPDQDKVAHLDELVLGDVCRDRSSLAALTRIINMRRLLASPHAIRGKESVVCFTQTSLHDISKLRVYRPHRRRWDFEPYGIAIDRSKLVARGARPVIYGNEEQWKQLNERDRPFFQRTEGGDQTIDWRVEKEWRVVGDIHLTEFSAQDAIVFVPTSDEAKQLSKISPWPITILDKRDNL